MVNQMSGHLDVFCEYTQLVICIVSQQIHVLYMLDMLWRLALVLLSTQKMGS
jgi:hypothetical protein